MHARHFMHFVRLCDYFGHARRCRRRDDIAGQHIAVIARRYRHYLLA